MTIQFVVFFACYIVIRKKFIIDFLFFAYVEKKISQSKLTRLLTNIDSFKKRKCQ